MMDTPPQQSCDQALRDFVRTPFAVRCNVVKVWRALPARLWEGLDTPADVVESKRREHLAAIAVVLMAAAVTALAWGGLYNAAHHSPWLVLWTVLPPSIAWASIRLWWIPSQIAGRPFEQAGLVFGRYLSGVYFYVYLMIFVGAVLNAVLAGWIPGSTGFLRWALWYFLFGESFFVPAVLWLRMIVTDVDGRVFGRYRHALLVIYVALFVVLPIAGVLMGVCVGRPQCL